MYCPDKIFEESKEFAKNHSPNLDSQYAFQVGYLKGRIIELCDIINFTRSQLDRVSSELKQIGEI